MVLEAAAKADEALKAKERNEEEAKRRKEEDQATLGEQVKRVKEIEAIESDSFVQQTFRSSKDVKKSVEPSEVKHVTPASGPASVAADPPSTGKEIDPDSIPTAIKYQDDNSLAHPNVRPLNLVHLLTESPKRLSCPSDSRKTSAKGSMASLCYKRATDLKPYGFILIWCWVNMFPDFQSCSVLTKNGQKWKMVFLFNN